MRTDKHAATFDREAWSRRANEIRARVPMSSVVKSLWKGIALKKGSTKDEWIGLCPYHSEQTPSFTVNDKKGFSHCFGCGAHHDAIAMVLEQQFHGDPAAFREAVELLESENGLTHLQASKPAPARPAVRQAEDVSKARKVERMWGRRREIRRDGPVDRYLRGRGLRPPGEWLDGASPANAGWGEWIWYDPECWHGLLDRPLPAMLTGMVRGGLVTAVHRTYLKITGVGVTKAGTDRDKAYYGEPAGALILLGPIADQMVGGEGIETSLSAMMLFKRSGLAFGARAGMAAADLPFECSDFIYAADRNKAHPDPKRSRVGEAAARAGLARNKVGRTVQIKIPNLPGDGLGDFNDMLQLMQRAPLKESA